MPRRDHRLLYLIQRVSRRNDLLEDQERGLVPVPRPRARRNRVPNDVQFFVGELLDTPVESRSCEFRERKRDYYGYGRLPSKANYWRGRIIRALTVIFGYTRLVDRYI